MSVGLAVSCCSSSLIETSLSLCPEASQSDSGRSKGLCSGISGTPCDQTQFNKGSLCQINLSWVFRLVGLDFLFCFLYSLESRIVLVVFSVLPPHSLSFLSYEGGICPRFCRPLYLMVQEYRDVVVDLEGGGTAAETMLSGSGC